LLGDAITVRDMLALAAPVIAGQEALVIRIQEVATAVQRFVDELVIG